VFLGRRIVRPSLIPGRIRREAMQLWLCSFGGCGTNMLADYLTARGLVVKTPLWHSLLCHHAAPVSVHSPLKAIYVYGDPILSLRSMKRRPGLGEVNLAKLNNRTGMSYSDASLFRSMLSQFERWTRPNRTNVDILVVRSEDLFESGKHAIAEFLALDVGDFPERISRAATSPAHALACEADLVVRFRRDLARMAGFGAFRHFPPQEPWWRRSIALLCVAVLWAASAATAA
jgi:hypothetical protein